MNYCKDCEKLTSGDCGKHNTRVSTPFFPDKTLHDFIEELQIYITEGHERGWEDKTILEGIEVKLSVEGGKLKNK